VVLLHSSADDDELLRTCKELKINQRLVKPIKIQEMYYALSHLYVKPSFQSAGAANPLPEHVSIGENIHVLIAEDNMVNMQLARTIVHKNIEGVIIHEAKNGAEAIDICKRITPNIILMDIQMPEINGLQATETIRKMHKNVYLPIIALTAGNVKGEKEKCMAAGMDDFITKPFVEQILITTIIKWMKQPVAEQIFDAGVMKKNMGSLDDETVRLLLGTSLNDLEKAAVSLQEGYALNDLQRLKQTGHGIKGVAATVGLTALSQAGFELEITENSQYLQATVAKVQEQLHKGIAAVQQFLSREG
jgi:CheY-like chemotaxis protein/HPt (histidine-containing phosphotransfer) domain-containing protein